MVWNTPKIKKPLGDDYMHIKKDDYSGTMSLISLILRRDRIILPVLILFLALVFISIAAIFVYTYSDAVLREGLVLQIRSNPASVAFLGSILDSSVGGLVAWRSAVIGPILVALMSIFLMIRHTRSEERKGRLELLNSAAVGRQALLTSALITTCGANILLGTIIVISFMGLGLPWEGSVATGLAMALFGCLLAVITGVAVQLTESSSDARYITITVLIVFFLIRMVGWDDGQTVWLSWFSPLGWVHHISAFAGEEWWIFGLFTIFILGLLFLAYYLSSQRDVGAGILPQREGPARAPSTLTNSLGLAWRLQRGMLFFWVIIFALMGVLLGYNAQTVTNLFTDNPQFMNILTQLGGAADPLDSYITMMLLLLGQVFAIYGILAALKLRSEEVKKHSEFLITNSVSRTRWVLSNLFFALVGPVLVLIAFSLSYSLTYGIISGVEQDVIRLVSAALVYTPAIWVVVGIAVALFGLVPRLTSLTWLVMGLFLIINLLADFLDVNQWVLDISPFTHVPNMLLGDTVGWSLVLVVLVAVFLISIGIVGYRRRDIT
jgi:ABC-2 type transport system permease protein